MNKNIVSLTASLNKPNIIIEAEINPENNYAFSSEKSGWKMLYKWRVLSPRYVENTFRKELSKSKI